jgi:hypothetical protein
MGIDAVAVLRIRHLAAPATGFGPSYPVEHRGDASLLSTMGRFNSEVPDEHGLALRKILGATLDTHDDPRGILLFPDVIWPKTERYATMIEELLDGGVWVLKVNLDHIPRRFTQASPGTHDALLAQMVAVMGRDPAVQLDLLASVGWMGMMSTPERADFADQYRHQIAAVSKAMGDEFANRYAASLKLKVDAETRQAAAARERMKGFLGGQ